MSGTRYAHIARRLLITAGAVLFLYGLVAYFYPPARHPFRYLALMNEAPPTSLPVPVRGVRARDLRDTWGAARSGGRRHEGIDIFARRNTPVTSTTRGMVISRGTNSLGGLIVTIIGPGGYRHYYAHLSRHGTQKMGEWVEPGEVIGYVGSTGNARGTPPHLHYGIYKPMGGAVNPYPLLVSSQGRRRTAQ